jgi:hypothetical protein
VIDLARGNPLDDRHVGVRQPALQRKLVRFEEACCQQELFAQAAECLAMLLGEPATLCRPLLGGAWEPADDFGRFRPSGSGFRAAFGLELRRSHPRILTRRAGGEPLATGVSYRPIDPRSFSPRDHQQRSHRLRARVIHE